jgi:hypothetical protein
MDVRVYIHLFLTSTLVGQKSAITAKNKNVKLKGKF